jgi:hypothetical protein
MQSNGINKYLIRHDLNQKFASVEIYRAIKKFCDEYPNSDPMLVVEAYRKVYSKIAYNEAEVAWDDQIQPVLNGMLSKSAEQIGKLYFWRNEIVRFFETIVRPIAISVADTTIKLLQELNITPETPRNQRRELLLDFLEKQKGRSINLGRTATTHAMNKGEMIAMLSSGLPWKKAWVSIKDERTRNAHVEMSASNYIALDQPFIVGGELMLFPADGSLGASIGNIANCRCGMAFRLSRR